MEGRRCYQFGKVLKMERAFEAETIRNTYSVEYQARSLWDNGQAVGKNVRMTFSN
jgi:hypothetical protein